ncbi:MAG: CBS domain-containing protein [Ghiorsea sp.]
MIAKHVMSTGIKKLCTTSTVKDAIDLFSVSHLHDIPVVDDNNKPIGIVTAKSILHFAVPAYASSELLAVLQSGPDIPSVYDKLNAIHHQAIEAVMDKNIMVVKEDVATSAVAAMLINLSGDTQNILVVDSLGVLSGVVSSKDIISKHASLN